MKVKFILFALFLWMTTAQLLQAQNIPAQSEELARQEIESRGLDMDEVKSRLQARGFDLDNIKPEQLPELETALQEVIQEMEKENKLSEGFTIQLYYGELDKANQILNKYRSSFGHWPASIEYETM